MELDRHDDGLGCKREQLLSVLLPVSSVLGDTAPQLTVARLSLHTLLQHLLLLGLRRGIHLIIVIRIVDNVFTGSTLLYVDVYLTINFVLVEKDRGRISS